MPQYKIEEDLMDAEKECDKEPFEAHDVSKYTTPGFAVHVHVYSKTYTLFICI